MATVIRLTRKGTKGSPFYRIVVMDERKPRDGRYIDLLGTYNPKKSDTDIVLDEEKAVSWLKKGVKVSDTVRSILSKKKIYTKLSTK